MKVLSFCALMVLTISFAAAHLTNLTAATANLQAPKSDVVMNAVLFSEAR